MTGIIDKIRANEDDSRWLIKNYNRRFRDHLTNFDDVVSKLRSLKISDQRIFELAKAYNTVTGVAW